MLSAQKAFTAEIDDVDAAVADIKSQLDLDDLKTHTIGLVSGLYDYIETGVVAALQEALPFDLIGQTSIATSATDSDDLDQLSLLVLSSDDVAFGTALSAPITGENPEALAAAYNEASEGHEDKPAFILGYLPLLVTVSGDYFVSNTNDISNGVPFIGALSVDSTMDYHNSRVIYKGQDYPSQLVYLLVFGNVQPRFYMAGITHGKIINETGVVTSSSGSQLQGINDAPVPEFLKDRGITANEQGEYEGINSFPYIVDYNDGTEPVIRVMFGITPEGYAICGGDIPVGATLAVSFFDENEILESSKASMSKLAEDIATKHLSAVVAFSCIGRYFTLGYEPDAEAQLLHEALDASEVPYTFTYCGGEICPVPSAEGADTTVNRAHNSTFIAVAF